MADGFRVRVYGDREIERALRRLPNTATREVKDGAERMARQLANRIRASGRAESRIAAAASRTVRIARGVFPIVVAGPEKRLMGSEFGARRRFGWFADGRYYGLTGQYPARQAGNPGRWYWPAYREYSPQVRIEHRAIARRIVSEFPQ